MMYRNQSVDTHRFSMIPQAEIPRSAFNIQKTHKTTFDSGYLIPIYVDEVLPGDTFNLNMTAFARLATPLFPIMDNMYMDSFFFFVPNRLIWNNWQRFMGEQDNPGDSISYIIPTTQSPAGGYDVNTLQDYMGLPTVGQLDAEAQYEHANLWPRAYNLIWNQWFRDENLQASVVVDKDDGPDLPTDYKLLRRGKRHDYFTSALPWPEKGGNAVTMPLGATAPVLGSINTSSSYTQDPHSIVANGQMYFNGLAFDTIGGQDKTTVHASDSQNLSYTSGLAIDMGSFNATVNSTHDLYVDLAEATASTINQLRTSFQVQKLLERDARGGTRYTEIVRSHFGVVSPDARLQRAEYLGGGTTPIAISPIAQTSGTAITGSDTPLGNLGAIGSAVLHNHGFTNSFTEHGVIIGLVSVRADLTYQQGVHKMWNRSTRYDFYFPAFAMLGEQAILNKEIYATGGITDDAVFGYQERWAEYRYKPSQISGYFKSTNANPIDGWHLAQHFTALPTLGDTFIQDHPPLQRVIAVGDQAKGQEFIFDSFFNIQMARPMPMYSVPGLIDHF
jgi:hypothetical protein